MVEYQTPKTRLGTTHGHPGGIGTIVLVKTWDRWSSDRSVRVKKWKIGVTAFLDGPSLLSSISMPKDIQLRQEAKSIYLELHGERGGNKLW